jgi:hypothetical protein
MQYSLLKEKKTSLAFSCMEDAFVCMGGGDKTFMIYKLIGIFIFKKTLTAQLKECLCHSQMEGCDLPWGHKIKNILKGFYLFNLF